MMLTTVFLLALAMLQAPSGATAIKVNDAASLQAAADEAHPGDTILLAPGTYRLGSPVSFAGKSDIVVMAEGGEGTAVISGGMEIPIRSLNKAKGLHKGVRCIDLKPLGFTGISDRGYGHENNRTSWTEPFVDGRPMRLSTWPDKGWAAIDSVVVPGASVDRPELPGGYGTIAFRDSRPMAWKNLSDVWINGSFIMGWTEEMVMVKSISPLEDGWNAIEVAEITAFGFGSGKPFQKWQLLNIPEEINEPGEYALDAASGIMYLMLPEGAKSLEISVLDKPLFDFDGCRNVSCCGLEFTCSRGDAVHMKDCCGVSVDSCIIQNIGHIAAVIEQSCSNSGLSHCTIYDMGAGAVEISGGDRKNLVRGDNYIDGCTFHDYNRIDRSYRPAIRLYGMGNRVSGCEIYNSATQAIILGGNDQLIELCDIHNVCMDIEDMGAIYSGRNPSEQGNVIRWCHFHDMIVPFNVRAVYHDDGECGCEVYGNLFERISSSPVQIGGGSDIHYHDNVFRDLPCAAVKIDARLKTWGAPMIPMMKKYVSMVDSPAFREHYPDFEAYIDGDFTQPKGNTFERNLMINVKCAFEKVVWDDHDFNNIIEGEANFMDKMKDNKIIVAD